MTPNSTKLRYINFHPCWRAELWTPKILILFIQTVYEKTYIWIFGYEVLNGNEIFSLHSLILSLLFFPFTSQMIQFPKIKLYWTICVFRSYLQCLFEKFFILRTIQRGIFYHKFTHVFLEVRPNYTVLHTVTENAAQTQCACGFNCEYSVEDFRACRHEIDNITPLVCLCIMFVTWPCG